MTINILRRLFRRDLEALIQEVNLYKQESSLWLTDGQISNPAGNLCLHLVGNLNTYIGQVIGHTGYVRDRDREFSDKNVARTTLLRLLEDTVAMIDRVLAALDDAILPETYPMSI